jgi:inhibitor of cysteine peptidase
MKKVILFGLISVLLIPLLMAGCSPGTPTNTRPQDQTIEVTLNEFAAQPNILKNIDLAFSSKLTVKLGANPTTGYNWTDAEITVPDTLKQISRNYVSPDTKLAGAGGTEVWVFDSVKPGTVTMKMSYARSWESKAPLYTLTIVIHVNVYLG